MLSSLHIENIAVIERADVDFDTGFNVLTGETGAGKSILIDSINAVLGMRTSKELIRTGAQKASVTAVFTDISKNAQKKLSNLGFTCENNELLIQRVITEQKSTVKINSTAATTSVLREIAPYLINIHGQHDSQALLDPEKHFVYIDLLAGNEKLLQEYRAAFVGMQTTRKRLKQLSTGLDEREKRAELFKFQIDELKNADIKSGEINELKNRQNEINNSQTILEALNKTAAMISSDDEDVPNAVSLIDAATAELENITSISNDSQKIYSDLFEVREKLDEIKEFTKDALNGFDFDDDEISTIEARLDMFYAFSHKYGKTEEEMLKYLDDAQDELKTIELSDDEVVTLHDSLSPLVERVKELGARLTESRTKTGEIFSENVAKQLEYLDMPKVKIVVDCQAVPYSRNGADKIEFLISTNPGEPPKPLSKIASGGEMSRIMLSIKSVLAAKDPVDTLIFDEIDAGISGHAATKVGKKMKQTAHAKQVICVTHLAQIAAMGDNHLLILKKLENDRATTKITLLDIDGRRKEIARIIGSKVTDATLQAADELLNG